jgi:hypothetical protein
MSYLLKIPLVPHLVLSDSFIAFALLINVASLNPTGNARVEKTRSTLFLSFAFLYTDLDNRLYRVQQNCGRVSGWVPAELQSWIKQNELGVRFIIGQLLVGRSC